MVGQLTHRRGAARPMRRPDTNKTKRSNFDFKRKLVAKAMNQARRGSLRASLRKPADERGERSRVPASRVVRGPEPPLRVRRSPSLPPPARTHDDEIGAWKKTKRGTRGRRQRRTVLKEGITRGEVAGRSRENNGPIRADSRRNSRDELLPARVGRRASPHLFPNERRSILHRESPPRHDGMQSFPIRGEPPRTRHEDHRRHAIRNNERPPLRQSFSPRMREESRGHRDFTMSPLEKEHMFYDKSREAPRGRIVEAGRLLPSTSEREAMIRRNRSPLRHKRLTRPERDGDLERRPRDGPSSQPERPYGLLEGNHHRMIPRGLEELHRRPAGDRGAHYPGRGIGSDYPRTRSITPPPLRLMKGYPPRGHIHDMESNYRLMRSGRREDFGHGREPMPPPPYDVGRDRVRMDPYGIGPQFGVRMLRSRRSVEREMERREREWHSSPLGRLPGPMPPRGRSTERSSRYNIHFDPLSRR